MTSEKAKEREFPLLGESHHGGFATRKQMKIATPRFVAGLTGVIPAFWEGIFEVGEGEGSLSLALGRD
jgi:hypothetical protein